jgi:hypothetical protein
MPVQMYFGSEALTASSEQRAIVPPAESPPTAILAGSTAEWVAN